MGMEPACIGHEITGGAPHMAMAQHTERFETAHCPVLDLKCRLDRTETVRVAASVMPEEPWICKATSREQYEGIRG